MNYFKIRFLFFTILFLCLHFITYCQSYPDSYYTIEDDDVIWQKVYETNKSISEMTGAFIKTASILNYQVFDSTTVIGELKNLRTDFENLPSGAGSPYAAGTLSGAIRIDFNTNKYRVTIRRLLFHPKSTVWVKSEDNEEGESLTDAYYNKSKGKWRYPHNSILLAYNQALQKYFDPNSVKFNDKKDW